MSSFGDAIAALKVGRRVTRPGWNGAGMFLFLVRPNAAELDEPSGPLDLPVSVSDLWDRPQLPVICMMTATNKLAIGWSASQADLLADDWETLP